MQLASDGFDSLRLLQLRSKPNQSLELGVDLAAGFICIQISHRAVCLYGHRSFSLSDVKSVRRYGIAVCILLTDVRACLYDARISSLDSGVTLYSGECCFREKI